MAEVPSDIHLVLSLMIMFRVNKDLKKKIFQSLMAYRIAWDNADPPGNA